MNRRGLIASEIRTPRKRKRHPNYRLVKIHHSYTVEEIARLFGSHRNTVRRWLKLGLRLYRFAVVRPWLYRLGGQMGGFGLKVLARNGWIRKLPGPLAAWTEYRDFPAFAPKSFNQRWQEERGN